MAANTSPLIIMSPYTINAPVTSALENLQHLLSTDLLPENEGYTVNKVLIYRLQMLVKQYSPQTIIALAIEARAQPALRTVALLLMRELTRCTHNTEHSQLIAPALVSIMRHPEDLTDFVDIYWLETKQPLTKQVKKAFALALQKFDDAQLAQCSNKQQRKLRDILRLVHPKPKTAAQANTWRLLTSA